MQASQATFQEGAFKPKQQDKRNELSIQTAGKKETSSRDTTEIETTFCREVREVKKRSQSQLPQLQNRERLTRAYPMRNL